MIQRSLRQNAVYWGSPSDDGYGGFTFADPVDIKCRWEYRRDLVTSDGDQVVSEAMVFVSRDLEEKGYLYLGSTEDISSANEDDPTSSEVGAYQIKRFDKLPVMNRKGDYLRVAYL